ncbi:MAG: choice-of-anchor G family protein [Sporichthyaceae bacterium]
MSARHKRHTPKRTHRGAAVAVTGVVSAGMVMAGVGPAAAAEKPVSQARGYFLSGSALGVNLDDIVELEDARAKNFGGGTDRELNPLSATLLNSLEIPIGPINLLEDNGLIELGAVNQAAIAHRDGSAVGASGAVTDSGAIAVDGDDDVPAANATVDLGDVLGADVLGALADVELEVGALAASAKQAKGTNRKQTGDYRIAQLKLTVQSPLLGGLLGPLTSQLGLLQGDVAAAGGLLGALPLAGAVDGLPVLAELIGGIDTSLGGGNNPVSADLVTGTIIVDVEELLISLGLDLNNLPANTEILHLILGAIATNVVGLVTDELDALVDSITAAVGGITVAGGVLDALIAPILDDLLATLLAPVTDAQNNVTGAGPLNPLLDPVFDALEGLVSLVVNAQSRSNGAFTQRALVIQVLPGAEPLARVNLASASVGPGAGPEDDDDDDDDDGGDDPSIELPHTGTAGNVGLGVAGLALVLGGSAAAAAGSRSRGRHARH